MEKRVSAKAKRRKAGYEPDVPRCQTCRHFRKAHLELHDSLPHWKHHWCKRGEFIVQPMGCCDHWTGHDGSTFGS